MVDRFTEYNFQYFLFFLYFIFVEKKNLTQFNTRTFYALNKIKTKLTRWPLGALIYFIKLLLWLSFYNFLFYSVVGLWMKSTECFDSLSIIKAYVRYCSWCWCCWWQCYCYCCWPRPPLNITNVYTVHIFTRVCTSFDAFYNTIYVICVRLFTTHIQFR